MDRLVETTGSEPSRDPTSLEDAVAAFVDALEHEREGLWEASWAVSRAVEACGISQRAIVAQIGSQAFSGNAPGISYKGSVTQARRTLFGAFAQAGACSIARVAQLCAVGEAFPDPAHVAQDKSHTWHRKVAQWARALGLDVLELQANALREGWGQRELDQLGRETPGRRLSWRGECFRCHARISVTSLNENSGEPKTLRCPCCDALAIGELS